MIIQDSQQSERHVEKILRHKMVRNTGTAFNCKEKKTWGIIITMIKTKDGIYWNRIVVSLQEKKHGKKMERIHRMATKIVLELEGFQYEERLNKINLQTLEQRRERGDPIQIYNWRIKRRKQIMKTWYWEKREIQDAHEDSKKLRESNIFE